MGHPRLVKGSTTIQQIIDVSKFEYKTDSGDNKIKRVKLDIINGKIIMRRGLTYNKSTKKWDQDTREVRLDFIVKSDPVSYPKNDTVPIHKYPVTFLIKDWDSKYNSPFRWRTGGLKKWQSPKRKISEGKTEAEKDRIRKENQKIVDQNIKNGLQGDFIFSLMWTLKQYGLLFGPLTCKNLPPKIKNPQMIPYFDKTAWFIAVHVLRKLFNNPKVNQLFAK